MSEDISTKLQRNRDAIDAIDHQVVDLLNKRVVSDGGADEATVLAKVAKFNQGPLSDATLQAIYWALMIAGLDPAAQAIEPSIVDELDLEIVNLLNQRVKHAGEIGEIKHANGADYYDPTREAQVMAKVCSLNRGPIKTPQIGSVYLQFICGGIPLEKK